MLTIYNTRNHVLLSQENETLILHLSNHSKNKGFKRIISQVNSSDADLIYLNSKIRY